MTIAQQLKIKTFPFSIKDENGKEIYREKLDGFWIKREYNDQGKEIYAENSDGFWSKSEYDDKGNLLYCENSDGVISDNRSNVVEIPTNVVEIEGIKYKLVKL